jgi:hypothetical protein
MGKKNVDDRFKKFGTVSFTAISKVNDFVGYLEKGKVMGTRCRECGRLFFPPRADCCSCFSSDVEWFEVTGKGKLITYSTLKFAPIGFGDDLPYSIALLDYGTYKVFGRISSGVSNEQIKVGMELKTTVNTLSNGQINYVFEMP